MGKQAEVFSVPWKGYVYDEYKGLHLNTRPVSHESVALGRLEEIGRKNTLPT